RSEISHADSPAGWRRACRDNQERVLFARKVEKMKQRAFVEIARREILDHERPGRKRRQRRDVCKRTRGHEARASGLGPNRHEVAFARTLWTNQQHHTVWPIGPALDQRKRSSIGR